MWIWMWMWDMKILQAHQLLYRERCFRALRIHDLDRIDAFWQVAYWHTASLRDMVHGQYLFPGSVIRPYIG